MPVAETFKTKTPELPTPAPADIYQLQLLDVTSQVQLNPFTKENEERLVWDFAIVDEGEHRGKKVRAWTANKWFTKANKKSKYFALGEAMLAGYGVKADLKYGETLSPNSLIGKQVRATLSDVRTDSAAYNKIEMFMPIKEEKPGLTLKPE